MATFAEQMVERLEGLMVKAAGLDSITIDGQAVRYTDLEEKHRYWKAQVARESGAKPVASTVDLSRTF